MNEWALSGLAAATSPSARHLLAIAVCLAVVSVQPLYGWPGHQWENWKRVTTWTRPDLKADQAGKKALVRLLDVRRAGEPPGRIEPTHRPSELDQQRRFLARRHVARHRFG